VVAIARKFNDEVVLPALSRLGIAEEDIRDYCNDGCSEIIMGGRGTINFRVYDSLSPLRETVLKAENHKYETFHEVNSYRNWEREGRIPREILQDPDRLQGLLLRENRQSSSGERPSIFLFTSLSESTGGMHRTQSGVS
jgi:hypothetical protein